MPVPPSAAPNHAVVQIESSQCPANTQTAMPYPLPSIYPRATRRLCGAAALAMQQCSAQSLRGLRIVVQRGRAHGLRCCCAARAANGAAVQHAQLAVQRCSTRRTRCSCAARGAAVQLLTLAEALYSSRCSPSSGAARSWPCSARRLRSSRAASAARGASVKRAPLAAQPLGSLRLHV